MLRRMILPMFFAGALAVPVLAQQQPADPGAGGGAAAPGGGNGGGRQRGQGGAGGGPGGGGQGRGNFDPAQFQQQRLDRVKEALGATDEEWKVLQPKVEKVMTSQRDAMAGGFGGGRGGRGGPGGGGPGGGGPAADAAAQTDVQKAAAALRATLDNKSASAEEITQKVSAYRDARDKARAALTAAQKDLKDVLTARQEAVLVSQSLLE